MDNLMPRYSQERKATVLKKLLPPHNRTVVSVAAEEGIADVTLYNWLKQCRQQGVPVPGQSRTGDDWSAEARLAVVIETAPMSETELSTYCREKGLFPEQVQQWKEACLQGAGSQPARQKEAEANDRKYRKKIKRLEAEVNRKDKALAETTALLVLSKKLEALYGKDPDNEGN